MTDSGSGAGDMHNEPGTSCAKTKKAFKDGKAKLKRLSLAKIGTVWTSEEIRRIIYWENDYITINRTNGGG